MLNTITIPFEVIHSKYSIWLQFQQDLLINLVLILEAKEAFHFAACNAPSLFFIHPLAAFEVNTADDDLAVAPLSILKINLYTVKGNIQINKLSFGHFSKLSLLRLTRISVSEVERIACLYLC